MKDNKQIEDEIRSQTVKQILNLVHVAQYQRGFSDDDSKVFAEFYQKVFLFTESAKLDKIGNKLEQSHTELLNYLQQQEFPAINNQPYKAIFTKVEGIATSADFRSKSGEIPVITKESINLNAIGSEKPKAQPV